MMLPLGLYQFLEKIMKQLAYLRAAIAAILIGFGAVTAGPVWAQDATPATATTPAATTAQPAAAAPAPAPAAAKETIEVVNPYGLDALWKEGDFITKATLVVLVIMSIGSWYIIVTKLFEQFKLGRQGKAANATFWTAGSVRQAIGTLEEGTPFHFISKSAEDALAHHEGLLAHIGLNAWITQSIQRSIENVQNRLQDGLAFLATVGATAPFVGLFGTVWGIYHALTAIGIAGQASIDKVAGPVGEALIMTAVGLFVAVPAVLGYNWLIRRNKAALESVRAFGTDLHAVLLGEAVATEPVRLSAVPSVKIANAAFAS
jgi:biopolymer transport protein ExbB